MLSAQQGDYAPFYVGYNCALNELGCAIRQSGSSYYALLGAANEYARLNERPFRESVKGGRKQFLRGYEYALRIFGEGAERLNGSDDALNFARWAYSKLLDDPTELLWLPDIGS